VGLSFTAPAGQAKVARLDAAIEARPDTAVRMRLRVRSAEGWSDWVPADKAGRLPAGEEAEVDVSLHTNDGYATPRVQEVGLVWD
jgi:hypothetical protein